MWYVQRECMLSRELRWAFVLSNHRFLAISFYLYIIFANGPVSNARDSSSVFAAVDTMSKPQFGIIS